MKNLAIVSDPSWGDVVSIYVYFRPDHSSPWEEQWIMMKRDILTHTDQPGEYQLQAKHFYRLEDGESFDPPLEKIIQVQPSTDPERDRMNTGGFF